MQQRRIKYYFSFGKDKGKLFEENSRIIERNNVELYEEFEYNDYNLNSTIGDVKDYFLTTFGLKYPLCRCELTAYYKLNNEYCLLTTSDDIGLNSLRFDRLYLLKAKPQCNCEFKDYRNFMSISTINLIKKLKITDLEMKNSEIDRKELKLEVENLREINRKYEELKKEHNILKNENEKLRKIEEITNNKFKKSKDFYDIIIDINSIKNVNKEGWKIEFNKKGVDKYNDFKNTELITIGVLGNNNKGKSFLLSKISKIKLLTGTSIQTKGLSVKYPELQGYAGRQIILLDSAGLETPVLRKNNSGKNIINEIVKKDDEKKGAENNKEHNTLEKSEEFKQNEEFKDNTRDKIMTELFLQNCIINASNILLIVVGILTYSEQLLINKIKIEAKKQNKERLIIIHNLQEFRTKEQVKDYIDNTLLKCSTFNLTGRTWISTDKKEEEKEENIEDKGEEHKNEVNQEYIDNNENNINNEKEDSQNEVNLSIKKDENINNLNKSEEIDFNNIKNEIEKNDNNEQQDEIPLNLNQNSIIHINPQENNELLNNNKNNEIKSNDIEEVNKNINIKKSKEKLLNEVHYTEIVKYGEEKKLEIFHLIMANEDSEAGDFYNEYAYKFIENIYNIIIEPKKFDVFEHVKDNFKKLSKSFLIDNIDNNKFNEDIINDKVMKLNFDKNKELSLKKCYTDELGFSLFKTGKFEPKYNYFKSDNNTLEIRLEIPGNCSCKINHKVEKDETIITIKGNKKKDSQPKEPNYNLINTREFTDFELNIPLKVEDFKIKEEKPKEGYPKFINGICLIQYELVTEGVEIGGISDSKDL